MISAIYSILACLFWGLIFVIPLYLADFASFDIVLGRFLVFGAGSVVSMIYFAMKGWDWKLFRLWKQASLCAIVMNLGYFTALTLGMRLSNPSLVTLIVGLAPILIAALTCKGKKLSSILLGPSLCIFAGIVLLNIESLQAELETYSLGQYCLGAVFGLLALGAWTWYVIYNTELLQKNPDVDPSRWTALIGVVTLGFAAVAALIRLTTMEPEYLQRFSLHEQGLSFFIGSLVLGLLCSLVAFTLWNIASAKLPSAMSGQLAILETVFGLVYIAMFMRHLPTLLEVAGMGAILGGVWRGLYLVSKAPLKRVL